MNARRVSVIVRYRDEETHLGAVLAAIRAQRCSADVELVTADNASTDASRRIADRYADVSLDIDDYRPGAALNDAITASSGDVIVIVSAHAIPADDGWLETLVAPLADPGRLAVYGAQIYPLTSRFLDKRDLDIFSDPNP